MRRRESPNQDERPTGSVVDTLVLHYTGMQTGAAAIDRLCDPSAKVSSHYVVEEDGTIWQLVPDARRAFHAGVSHWRGREGLNATSIGIEVVNPGHDWGYRDFPALQMAALCDLCRAILDRHPCIAPWGVVAHSDIAPDRKQDPGELFDWPGLAANGVGLWPRHDPPPPPPDTVPALLTRIGYRCDLPLQVPLAAFQRRWRPERVDGVADAGTLRRLAAVAWRCPPPG